MEPRNPSDLNFELVPNVEPGYYGFRVPVADSTRAPGSYLAAGTTFAAAGIPTRARINEGLRAYVFTHFTEAAPGWKWANFARALPTIPIQEDGLDLELWGPAHRSSYLDLASNTRPDRGDLFSISSSTINWTWADGSEAITWANGSEAITQTGQEFVHDVQEQQLGPDSTRVVVTTVPSNTLVITETSIDESSGEAIDRTTTYTLSATKPAGASVGDDGYGTTVDRVSHNLWKSTRAKLHGLPTAANPRTWADKESMYWPPVLVHYEFQSIRNPNRNISDPWFEKKLFTYMKEGYSAPVDVDVVEWWQKEEPAALDQAPMVPTRIYIAGMFQTINIPECLHGEFVYTEAVHRIRDRNPNTTDYESVHEDITLEWRIGPTGGDDGANLFFAPATGNADWPETYKVQEVIPEAGGFRIRQKTFHRPDVEVELSVTSLGRPSYYERLHT